ncbi:MAG: hypothetical protein V4525_06950 [Pseudomonadota bacterium]
MAVPIRLEQSSIPSQYQISSQQPDAKLLRLEPGQVLTGRVVPGTGENGVSRLLWSGYTFDLPLTEAVPVGTQVQLKVVSNEGAIRLQYIAPNAGVASSQVPGEVQLSSMSQWLAGLMESVLSGNDGNASDLKSNMLQALTPLNADKSLPSADKLATQLQTIIEKSGLFYESHQAQWAQGHKTIDALLDQPQARWSVAGGGVTPTNAERNAFGIPNSLVSNIEQQLGILEGRAVQWRGELLPGVALEWHLQPLDPEELEDEEQRKSALNDPENRPWMTQFEISLSTLGLIYVNFQVYKNYVNWYLQTENPATKELLVRYQDAWIKALQARGVNTTGTIESADEI